MKTKLFIAIISLSILLGWTTKQISVPIAIGIKKAAWLIGTWENKTPKGSIYETWSKANEHEFLGKSYIIRERLQGERKDTIIFENIRLVQEQDGLCYIPTVKNQNGGLPVRFAAKTISATQLIFENPKHDFPQTISYTKIGADSLVAEISGTKNGQARKQTFQMKKVGY